jgi:hypothetical protein
VTSSVDEELDGFAPYIAVNSKTTPVFSTKGDQVRLSERRVGRRFSMWHSGLHVKPCNPELSRPAFQLVVEDEREDNIPPPLARETIDV